MPVTIKDVYVSSANAQVKNTNLASEKIVNIDDRDPRNYWDTRNVDMTMINDQDDGDFSKGVKSIDADLMGSQLNLDVTTSSNSATMKSIYHGVGLFSPDYIKNNIYTSAFRYGLANPYTAINGAREYLFFTKPDLHIYKTETSGVEGVGAVSDTELNDILQTSPFWVDLSETRKDTTLKLLQYSRDPNNPFNYLLQNQCKSNLDIPGLTSEMVDTPVNDYGVGYSYRGSSEASDDGPEFSLEFKDNRFLDTYYFFKAYEEYEVLKHHGTIWPAQYYTLNRIIHDCFSIYKFIVADDMETIIYWGKMYGVVPKSLPRDAFSNPVFDDGLSYSIDFKAAFYEDMRPEILGDFNYLGANAFKAAKYKISPYNSILGRPDTRPATAAKVVVDTTSALALSSPAGYVYKLIWKGDNQI